MKTQKIKLGEDFSICDLCSNYSRSEGGSSEFCNAKHLGSRFILRIDELYISERMNGNKTNCKEFKR